MSIRTILPLLAVAALPFSLFHSTKARSEDNASATRLSGPFTHGNLSIYLVHGKSADGPIPLTLEEALDKKAVTVHETGSVSELAIENTGSEDILIHAGDIVKGGQQDRVLTTTMVLKPKSGKVPLAAFCVEQGRWSARGQEDVKRFASAKEMMPSREAKLAMKAKNIDQPPVTAGLRRERIEPSAAQTASRNEDRANIEQRLVQTGPGRSPAGANAQGEVWKNVSGIQAALSANLGAKVNSEASESSLQLALENEKVLTARKAYLDALEPAALKDNDVIGYAFAINGKINSADIYASNALFRKLWPRLIKASATEALGAKTEAATSEVPKNADVEVFLADAAKGKEQEHVPAKGLKLKVRAGAAMTDFETLAADGGLVHRNVLAH